MRAGDHIICLVDDEPRGLLQGQRYEITTLIYRSNWCSKEQKKNLSVYVNVGDGWQASLDKEEYELD